MKAHQSCLLFACLLISLAAGCSDDDNSVPGRVAIEITLSIDGKPAPSGTLILRPKPGVACPLVRLPIADGKGSLTEQDGPVPGEWNASFRSDTGNLTDQLEKQGRSDPLAQPGGSLSGGGSRTPAVAANPADVVIPDDNPAKLQIDLSTAP